MAETVFLGEHELTFPGPHLGVLRDCNAVLAFSRGLTPTDSRRRVSTRSRFNRQGKESSLHVVQSLNMQMADGKD